MKENKTKKGNARARHGRKKRQCERYRRESRREKNKARRLARHLCKCPRDGCAEGALQRLADENMIALQHLKAWRTERKATR